MAQIFFDSFDWVDKLNDQMGDWKSALTFSGSEVTIVWDPQHKNFRTMSQRWANDDPHNRL